MWKKVKNKTILEIDADNTAEISYNNFTKEYEWLFRFKKSSLIGYEKSEEDCKIQILDKLREWTKSLN